MLSSHVRSDSHHMFRNANFATCDLSSTRQHAIYPACLLLHCSPAHTNSTYICKSQHDFTPPFFYNTNKHCYSKHVSVSLHLKCLRIHKSLYQAVKSLEITSHFLRQHSRLSQDQTARMTNAISARLHASASKIRRITSRANKKITGILDGKSVQVAVPELQIGAPEPGSFIRECRSHDLCPNDDVDLDEQITFTFLPANTNSKINLTLSMRTPRPTRPSTTPRLPRSSDVATVNFTEPGVVVIIG